MNSSLLKPLTKKAIREMMAEDAGNWKRWPSFWRIDKSRFADPQRGILVHFPTEWAISDALIMRAMMKAAAGSERNIVWNGMPNKPFAYDEMSGYVSAMFFVCDEKGVPTPEYLMYVRLAEMLKSWYCLDDDDHEYREELRCRIVIMEDLMGLLRRKRAWNIPHDADDIILEHWKCQAGVNGGETMLHDLTCLPPDLIERVAGDHGWKRIPTGDRLSLERQKKRLMAKWKSLRNQIVRLTFGKNLRSLRQTLLADVRKLRSPFVR